MSPSPGYHSRDYATPPTRACNLLRSNPDVAYQLPAPDERVLWRDLKADFGHAMVSKLIAAGAIVKAGQVAYDDDADSDGHWWRTHDDVYSWVLDVLDHPEMKPCGCLGGGIRCVVSGELYECTNDDCDGTFGREAAEEVVS